MGRLETSAPVLDGRAYDQMGRRSSPGRALRRPVRFAPGVFRVLPFSRELYGEREGVVAAALYVLCPAVLFHNNQFVAETFLFSTAPLVYWSLLKAMQPGKARWLWTIVAVVIATALLLFKQSGTLLLTVSFFLPCMRLRKANETDQPKDWGVSDNWKEFAWNFLLVAAVVVAAQLAANALIPSQFDAAKEQFNGRWVMSPRELLELPIQVWSANLRLVGDYIGSYYSWLAPVFVGVFLWFGFRRKSLPDLALASMCLAGAIGVTFLLRGFNEYLFNTAVIVVLLPLLARTGVYVWSRARTGPSRLLPRRTSRARGDHPRLLGLSNSPNGNFARKISRGEHAVGRCDLP